MRHGVSDRSVGRRAGPQAVPLHTSEVAAVLRLKPKQLGREFYGSAPQSLLHQHVTA
jgi:hypothetical protein